ncbi:MAG: hypothetical protein JO314_02320 [Acidobacteria bacterium]|nr:hypothetical protein [Acidobacteriota bacterium]
MAIQPSDGKIVVAGYDTNSGGRNEFALARYNTDGSLDNLFGTGGVVTTAVGSVANIPSAMAIQPDGKIVVTGFDTNAGNRDEFLTARYNTDGGLDSNFGAGGVVSTPIGSVINRASAILVQPVDSKIVVAGFDRNAGNRDEFALVRYNADGSLDSSFGSGGVVTTGIGSIANTAYSIAIQSDNKILAAGYDINSGGRDEFAIARYNPTGSLDGTFGSGGIVTTGIGSFGNRAFAIGVQSDSKIVTAGYASNGLNLDFALSRYSSTGQLDKTFGVNGLTTTDMIGSDQALAMKIQTDGKIIAGGVAGPYFAFARYNGIGGSTAVSPVTGLSVAFSNVSARGDSVATPMSATQLPVLPSGYSLTTGPVAYDIRTSASYLGNVTVTLVLQGVPDKLTCFQMRSFHLEGGAWSKANNVLPSYNSGDQTCTVVQTVTSLSPFVVAQGLAPTAANVAVAGRVITSSGAGLRNAVMTLVDASGAKRTAVTNAFGYYSFGDLKAGQSIVVSVASRRYVFAPNSRVVNVNDDIADLDFVSSP